MSFCIKCSKKQSIAPGEFMVCRECGKTSDEDSTTKMYCSDCSEKMNACQACGMPTKLQILSNAFEIV